VRHRTVRVLDHPGERKHHLAERGEVAVRERRAEGAPEALGDLGGLHEGALALLGVLADEGGAAHRDQEAAA
jgi:hypothetical protein